MDYPNSLGELGKIFVVQGYKDWLASMLKRTCVLTIVSPHAQNIDGRCLLTFADSSEPQWADTPFVFPTIEFLDEEIDANVTGLDSFLGKMRIYLSGWHGANWFGGKGINVLDPAYGNLSEQKYYWPEISKDRPDIPVSEFIPFYGDSGTYLLLDAKRRVWCGGIVGPVWQSTLTLDETIDRIFSKHAIGYPSIHEMCDPPMAPM